MAEFYHMAALYSRVSGPFGAPRKGPVSAGCGRYTALSNDLTHVVIERQQTSGTSA
jgi:hypothetical protein